MPLEDIIKRIEDEADKEAESILDRARKKADEIHEEAREEIRNEIAERRKKLDRDAKNLRNVYISDGKRKSRQAILSAKEELIWDVISGVRKHMQEMEGDELEGFLNPMFEKARRSLGNDMIVYPVRKRDMEILKGRQKMGTVLEEGGIDETAVRRFKGHDLLGGFIASSGDGRKVLDMTFCGVLNRDEENIREVIARTLFGDSMRE